MHGIRCANLAFGESIAAIGLGLLGLLTVQILETYGYKVIGNIVYSASGDRAYSREQIEIFCEGSIIILTDFRETIFYIRGRKRKYKTLNQQMGHKEELQHFFDVITGKSRPKMTSQGIFISTLTVFKINEALEKGIPAGITI